jgi:hypothetical protein
VAPGELYLRLPHCCLLTAAAARHPTSSLGPALRAVETNGPPLDEITVGPILQILQSLKSVQGGFDQSNFNFD